MANLAEISRFYKIPELRQRVIFTLAMLAVYRIGIFITIPGVDRNAMRHAVAGQAGGLLGLFNLFTGGALENFSIFALGIMPYISASIIVQMAGMVYKPLDDLRKEGELGRRRIEQYTRYGAVVLSVFQGLGVARLAEGVSAGAVGGIVIHPGLWFLAMAVVTLTTGTAFLMWIGEQITERGISNGISLLIYAGIVTGIPHGVASYFAQNADNLRPLTMALIVAFILVAIVVIVFFETGHRQIPIVYSRRQVGRRIYGAQKAHLPLKVNMAGTIPPIFASSLLSFPATLAHLKIPGSRALQSMFERGDWLFNTGYALLIVFFCYFYTHITFQPVDIAENLKKQQANIPGIRPGRQTADYIQRISRRLTFGGAIYVATICVLPSVIGSLAHVPLRFGGTSLMIVVGVALDTVNQIEAHLIQHSYEGLAALRPARIRARRVPQG